MSSAASGAARAGTDTTLAEPSVGQKLLSSLEALLGNLTSLNPGEIALNLGLSVLVIAVVFGAVWVLRQLLRAGMRRLAPRRLRAHGRPRVAKLTWGLIRLLALAAALVGVLSIWGIDLWGWLTAGPGVTLTRILLIVLGAVAAVEVAGFLVDRLLRLAQRRGRGHRAAQMRTIAPLLRGFIQTFIVGVAALTVLSELGIQIAPLLASAGVAGIAIGFGAQSLVKDVLTGIFLIMEDIVAIGDNVRIGDRSGVVEAMTLRTIRVRALDGTLHILPYGEAQVIDNRTKTYSRYVFDLGVGYGTDVDHALDVMRRVGAEMQADPEYGPLIEQPLEIMGLDAFADSAIMLKARFQTRPGEQWKVGREYNRRIKKAFDAEGIEIPFPQRTLSLDPKLAEALARLAKADASQDRPSDPDR